MSLIKNYSNPIGGKDMKHNYISRHVHCYSRRCPYCGYYGNFPDSGECPSCGEVS